MKKKLEAIIHSEGFRQSRLMVVGNVLSTGISAVALLLTSRVMGPNLFGQFSVGFAITVMLNKCNDMGLNASVIKYAASASNVNQQQAVIDYTSRLKFFISLGIIGVGALFGSSIADILHIGPSIIYAAFTLSVISSWYEHLQTILQSLHRFPQAVAINTIQATAKLLGVGILVLLQLALPLPIFFWYSLSPSAPFLFLKLLLPKNILFFDRNATLSSEMRSNILSLAKHSSLGFISAGIIENIDVLFVQNQLTEHDTGLLGGVSKIAMMITVIAYSLGNVLYPRVSRYKTKEHLSKYLRKASAISILSLLGYVCFLPFSSLFITLTIGPAYLSGTWVLNILAASAFIAIATIPFLALFYAFKADWYFSVSGIIQLAIVLVGNGVFVPQYGLQATAWTRLLVRLFLFIFTLILALWYYKKHTDETA